MQELLISKLRAYIAQNHPDLLIRLQEENTEERYLKDKVAGIATLIAALTASGTPAYFIEETCMDELTRDLRPSKFNYLSSVLADEFETVYVQWTEAGILTYEVINLIAASQPVFGEMGWNEDSDEDRWLRYAIIGTIAEYLAAPIPGETDHP